MAVINAGDVIAGKYRVERVLGEGGMGFVVAATHLTLEIPVAIKFIRDGALGTREASVRFLREAQAAVQIRNPHVAHVYDVGALETGEPFMVMEYLEGCDLSDLYKQRGALPPAEACEYVLQACDALGEAHSLGIIHRDVKLGNLFLTRGAAGVPIVKVLDFGLSKANPFGGGETGVTMSAAVLGSPRFMSPEQLQDPRTVDGRTDIWALGVILYTLLAGRPAFDAETVGKLFAKVMGESPPPLRELNPTLDPGLVAIVDRCLQKSLDARMPNVAELAAGLVPYCMNTAHAQTTAARLASLQPSPPSAAGAGATRHPTPTVPPASGRSTSLELGGPWAGAAPQPPPPEGSSRLWLGLGVALAVIGVAGGAFYVSRNQVPTGHAEVVPVPAEPPALPTVEPPTAPAVVGAGVGKVASKSVVPAAPTVASPVVATGPTPAAAPRPTQGPKPAATPTTPTGPAPTAPTAAPKPKPASPDIPTTRD
ncbi:MAG: protein kinase [Myxococcales bacterium]|jgi:serine/threonine-protein kinase|nr:protein kinase [Myxococcales bacterium]HQY63032.1 protein kinase [Polyangiaceae bacterium]